MSLILKVGQDPSLSAEAIRRAARIIVGGGVVAFPTETSYGLGVLVSHREAIERVYQLKRRAYHKSLSILVGNLVELQEWVETIPTEVVHLIERFWPGPLTLVFAAGEHFPTNLTGGTGKVAVRISSHPVAQALVQAVGTPITATSANRSGAPSCHSAPEVLAQLGSDLEAVLDGGLTPGSKDSTIADVTRRPPEILRVGAITAHEVLSCWEEGAEHSL
ncbi:MAG: threonylcarbamoyl-AMP synthase [Deltaproteobacteria bacterium]|nr:MAG: threonylcarbamoyl-AMP synthase [Deltaproteobacteria bacterium]